VCRSMCSVAVLSLAVSGGRRGSPVRQGRSWQPAALAGFLLLHDVHHLSAHVWHGNGPEQGRGRVIGVGLEWKYNAPIEAGKSVTSLAQSSRYLPALSIPFSSSWWKGLSGPSGPQDPCGPLLQRAPLGPPLWLLCQPTESWC
jgi:hypothetical protein